VLLVMVILVVVGTLVFIIASPNTGEKHTEFYILGPDGMVANYPRDITLGQASPVIAGITNREGQQNIYILDMLIEKTKLYSSGPVNLQNNEKWEQEIPIKPLTKAENQKVEFYLYKGTSAEPSLKLHIFVNVK